MKWQYAVPSCLRHRLGVRPRSHAPAPSPAEYSSCRARMTCTEPKQSRVFPKEGGAHPFLAFQAASTVTSCSGVSANRGAFRRASGTVGHQASVSRTVVAIGRNPSPAAFARALLIVVWPKLFPVGKIGRASCRERV